MKIRCFFSAVLVGVLAAISVTGCSHSTSTSQASSPNPQNGATVVTTATPQTFNPSVTPPSAATEQTAAYQAYEFNPQPAPAPAESPDVEHHLHRYLHIVIRDHKCYLEDNYGHFYNTGRDDEGNVYPVYRDPGTGADYPLYYDQERDEYYRCVDDGDNGYYRNYVGDPDNDFYEGDPDQQNECDSEQCQPFVVNYDTDYAGYGGYDPHYASYNGPHYSRHNSSFVHILPLIAAAFILLEPSNGNGAGNWHNRRQPVKVDKHNYYATTVIVESNHDGDRANEGARYAALPGPPIGHFQGYRGPIPAGFSRRAGHQTSTRQAPSHSVGAAQHAHQVSAVGGHSQPRSGGHQNMHSAAPSNNKPGFSPGYLASHANKGRFTTSRIPTAVNRQIPPHLHNVQKGRATRAVHRQIPQRRATTTAPKHVQQAPVHRQIPQRRVMTPAPKHVQHAPVHRQIPQRRVMTPAPKRVQQAPVRRQIPQRRVMTPAPKHVQQAPVHRQIPQRRPAANLSRPIMPTTRQMPPHNTQQGPRPQRQPKPVTQRQPPQHGNGPNHKKQHP